ncbi:hypothetical protein [Nocardia sp. NPDC051981]|uniref:hypothetical protein n=1 Tax=Nocardia sp. NPDC051981 TaxID=3155417 RepID=UPI00343CDC4C
MPDYLRMDVSKMGQLWDETQVRRLAERYGYDLAEVVVYDPKSGRPPLARLKAQATRLDAEAVIVPGPEHFTDGRYPAHWSSDWTSSRSIPRKLMPAVR